MSEKSTNIIAGFAALNFRFILGAEMTKPLCPSCGVQFGVMDETLFLACKERKDWLKSGAQWFDESQKPDNWVLEEQLANIPEKFK